MKYSLLVFHLFLTLSFSIKSSAQNGESDFKQVCAACHTIGKGRLVGPDLVGVTERRSEDWLLKFIKSSQSLVKSGDKTADSLFKAFNSVIMPDQAMDDAKIKDILAYITNQSGGSSTTTAVATENTETTTEVVPVEPGRWEVGQDLFVGKVRFDNGGPACNSCHNVSINGYISGGALAKDLTQAVSRLTGDGAKAFFAGTSLPMPQMQKSYAGRALTDQEVNDILAFLTYADEQAKTNPSDSIVGTRMLVGGILGVVALLALFTFIWIRRKRQTVNYSIFERQIHSN